MSTLPPSEPKPSLAVRTDTDPDTDPIVTEKGGTAQDGNDMHRMGKLQQLRV